MNEQHLSYFMIVYRHRNLSKAAEEIHISRQALSKIIADLETKVGKQLFIRKQNGLQPTAAAQAMIPHVQVILNEFSNLYQDNLMEKFKEKKVTFRTFDAVSQIFPPSFYQAFMQEYPEILLNIEETNEENAKNQLMLRNCDMAIVTDSVNYTDFDYTWLFRVPYGIFVKKDHPLTQLETVYCHDIRHIPMIGKTQALSYYYKGLTQLFEEGKEFEFVMETTNQGTALNLVKQSHLIAIAWDYSRFYNWDDSIVFLPVPDMGPGGMDVYLIQNPNIPLTKNQQIAKDYIQKWCEKANRKLERFSK